MKQIYDEFNTVIDDINCANNLSHTLVSAMKGCIAENEEAYHLLATMEALSSTTQQLYEKSEELSLKIFQSIIDK